MFNFNNNKEVLREIIVYLIVGVLTMIVTIAVYYLCTKFLSPYNPFELQVANVISWIIAVIFAYFANRKYTFRSTDDNIIKEGVAFVLSRIGTLILDMVIMFVMVTVLILDDRLSKIVSQIAVVAANYLTGKFWVFKKKKKECA